MKLPAHCHPEIANASLDAIYAIGAQFQARNERTQVERPRQT
jgi:hypothetical protein